MKPSHLHCCCMYKISRNLMCVLRTYGEQLSCPKRGLGHVNVGKRTAKCIDKFVVSINFDQQMHLYGK